MSEDLIPIPEGWLDPQFKGGGGGGPAPESQEAEKPLTEAPQPMIFFGPMKNMVPGAFGAAVVPGDTMADPIAPPPMTTTGSLVAGLVFGRAGGYTAGGKGPADVGAGGAVKAGDAWVGFLNHQTENSSTGEGKVTADIWSEPDGARSPPLRGPVEPISPRGFEHINPGDIGIGPGEVTTPLSPPTPVVDEPLHVPPAEPGPFDWPWGYGWGWGWRFSSPHGWHWGYGWGWGGPSYPPPGTAQKSDGLIGEKRPGSSVLPLFPESYDQWKLDYLRQDLAAKEAVEATLQELAEKKWKLTSTGNLKDWQKGINLLKKVRKGVMVPAGGKTDAKPGTDEERKSLVYHEFSETQYLNMLDAVDNNRVGEIMGILKEKVRQAIGRK